MSSAEPKILTKRLFLLGSGFSAAMGLPTLRGLFDGVMQQQERAGENNKDNVLQALAILYPHFQTNSENPVYPPFEEFLSLIVSAEDFPMFDDGYWFQKRLSALRLLTDFLASTAASAESDQLLVGFVENLQCGDVVVTFNWDNLIERALRSLNKAVNFMHRDATAITVLKLHGSLNWALIPEGLQLARPDLVTRLADNVYCTPDFTYYDLWNVLNQPPLIIPPISSKRPPAEPFLRGIWGEAFNALVEASNVTIIGYSIPPDDLQARALLTSSFQARSNLRYTVLDPDPSVGSRYFEQISPNLNYLQAYFSSETLPKL